MLCSKEARIKNLFAHKPHELEKSFHEALRIDKAKWRTLTWDDISDYYILVHDRFNEGSSSDDSSSSDGEWEVQRRKKKKKKKKKTEDSSSEDEKKPPGNAPRMYCKFHGWCLHDTTTCKMRLDWNADVCEGMRKMNICYRSVAGECAQKNCQFGEHLTLEEALGQGWENPRKKRQVNRVVNPLEIPDEETDTRKGVKSAFNPSPGSSEMRYLTVERSRTGN